MRELTWKSRFVVRLAELFVKGGQAADTAIADAIAHASACYLERKDELPEEAAEEVHRALLN